MGLEELRETIEDFRPEGGRDGEEDDPADLDLALSAAVHWLLCGSRDDEGWTPGERWEEAGWPGLNNDERVMSAHRCRSFATLLEIQRISDAQSVTAVDLWAGKGAQPMLLIDRTAAGTFRPFDLVLSWVTPYPHFNRFVGATVALPRDLRGAFEESWRDYSKERLGLKRRPTSAQLKDALAADFGFAIDLVRDLGRESMQQMLRNSDIILCRTYFSIVGDRQRILEALEGLPEFEPDREPSEDNLPESDAFVWLRRGESKRIEASLPQAFRHPDDESAGVGVLGRISVGRKEVMVQAMGRLKSDFALARVAEIFGPRLRLERTSQVDMAVQMAERLERDGETGAPGGGSAPPSPTGGPAVPGLPSEAKAHLIRTAMERHFQGLADAELPLFGGRSAREAALIPALRPKVLAWVKDQWNSVIQHGQRDGVPLEDLPQKLARELGLDELPEP